MTEVAGGREKRRRAVLVAAVTGHRREGGDGRLELRAVVERELERAQTLVVVDVGALAEPGADDDRRHARLLQDEARGDVGERDVVPVGHVLGRAQHALQGGPTAGLRG